jgi:hypothetical protein
MGRQQSPAHGVGVLLCGNHSPLTAPPWRRPCRRATWGPPCRSCWRGALSAQPAIWRSSSIDS